MCNLERSSIGVHYFDCCPACSHTEQAGGVACVPRRCDRESSLTDLSAAAEGRPAGGREGDSAQLQENLRGAADHPDQDAREGV